MNTQKSTVLWVTPHHVCFLNDPVDFNYRRIGFTERNSLRRRVARENLQSAYANVRKHLNPEALKSLFGSK